MHKAIFLDRDGTLNKEVMYAHKEEDYALLPGVIEGLRSLKEKGFLFFIITNQAGIGRGIFKEEDMHLFNKLLLSDLESAGIHIEKLYFCPHHPDDGCDCRKPEPRWVFEAAKEFAIDLTKSYMLGDHKSDMLMARNAGIKAVFLLTGHGKEEFEEGMDVDVVAEDFSQATRWILDDNRQG